jgi:hypothetical protein
MPFTPPRSIPGLKADASRVLLAALNGIGLDLTQALSSGLRATAVQFTSGLAQLGQLILCAPPAAGMTVLLPIGTLQNRGQVLQVGILTVASGGSVTVSVVGAAQTVNDAATLVLSSVGVVEFTSAGPNGWLASGAGGGGGGGGENLAATLAIGNTSGANDMVMNAGRFIQLGAVGPVTGAPQLRSGDATFRMRGAGNVIVTADGSSAALNCEGAAGLAILQAFGAGGQVAMSAQNATGTASISTNSTARLVIAASGEWTTPAGAAGQVLTHNGAAPPIWAAPAGGGTDPRIFAWFGV